MIIILGQPGTGKTTIGKHFSRYFDIAFLDKDIICDQFTFYIMKNIFNKENDKDSEDYKKNVREIEYSTFKNVMKSQIELDVSFVAVAPFTMELKEDSNYFDELYEFANSREYDSYFINIISRPEEIKRRIIRRNKPEDKFKILNWSEYTKRFENQKKKSYIKNFLNEDINDTIDNIINYIN